MRCVIALCVGVVSAIIPAASQDSAVLLENSFDSYPSGPLMGVVGAHAEYHYVPEIEPKGAWAVSTFRSDPETQLAWRAIRENGAMALAMVDENKFKHTHPTVVAGDPLWRDYTLEVVMAPTDGKGQCGVIVRYHNDRCYYFAGLTEGKAVLKRVRHEKEFRVSDELILAEAPFAPTADPIAIAVTVKGTHLRATIGDVVLEADDDMYPQGRVALQTDRPAKFISARVMTTPEEKTRVDAAIAARVEEARALQAANPTPVLWKRVALQESGVGRNMRFGDLDGDGQIDFASGQVRHNGPKDSNSEISCVTAFTFDGKRLWQNGQPDLWKNHLTNDVAFQIHDWDGDGKNEVIYCSDMEIVVADGATGEIKKRAPTPETPPNTKPPYNKFPRILGDCIYFCDLRGTGRDADMIIKDRYTSLWALDDNFNILWRAQCNTGHYPFAFDADKDGKDEVLVGYTLFDSDGTKLWSWDSDMKDHDDGVAVTQLTENGPWRVFVACSDEGAIMGDIEGNILKHHRIGHVQNPAVADFRTDMPGLEAVSVNYWGNQGIIHFYNSEGDPYLDFEPFQHGSLCLPINWTGQPPEFVVLSVNEGDGGMIDGYGRCAVKFPADGHPDMCYNVINVTGDCRDEVVVWDPYELWVYTQSDSPKSGKLYMPERNADYNESNYRAVVSKPGWNQIQIADTK